jgi:AcrR family transcriptional regulator
MNKTADTKNHILDTALNLVRSIGFESISIGELAKKVGMSKSGLFAHFKSKETLQIMIIDHASFSFTKKVLVPAIKKKRGLTRLNAIIDNWVLWSLKDLNGSCPLIAAAIEFDARPGVVKQRVQEHIGSLHQIIKRACKVAVEEGEFGLNADTDQMAQEIFSFVLSYHIYKKTLNDSKADKRFKKSIKDLIQRNLA